LILNKIKNLEIVMGESITQYEYFAKRLTELENSLKNQKKEIPYEHKRKYEDLLEQYNTKMDEETQMEQFILLLNNDSQCLRYNLNEKSQKVKELQIENNNFKKHKKDNVEKIMQLHHENTNLKKENVKLKGKNKKLKRKYHIGRKLSYKLEKMADSLKELPELIKLSNEIAADFDE